MHLRTSPARSPKEEVIRAGMELMVGGKYGAGSACLFERSAISSNRSLLLSKREHDRVVSDLQSTELHGKVNSGDDGVLVPVCAGLSS